MNVLGVIPARFGSTRFEGKPLAKIKDKPLLQWVIEGTLKSQLLSKVIVATDDKRIAELARESGVEALMTSSDINTGTERVWEVCRLHDCDYVVNVQGDEPLISGELIDELIRPVIENSKLEMVTLARQFESLEEINVPSTVKIVLNQQGQAIYFSRLPIPYSRYPFDSELKSKSFVKHIGLYLFRKTFLESFCQFGECDLEKFEGLEQLRALFMGAKIKVVLVKHQSWGVDYPTDIKKIEDLIDSGVLSEK